MSQLNKLYKHLQENMCDKFNEELFTLKDKDNVITYIEDACKSLEILDGIKFLGAKQEDERTLYKPSKTITDIPYERSILITIKFGFEITDPKTGEKEIINKKLYYPRLIDSSYFLIDNVRYYPIFQIIDAETYHDLESVILRTSLQPIVVNKKNYSIKPENVNDEIIAYYTFSKLFKTKIPIFIYLFANFGITNSLKFFNLENIFRIVDKNKIKNFDDYPNDYIFKLGTMLYLIVSKDYVDESIPNKVMLFTFLNAFQKKDKVTIEKADDLDYWLRKLGGYFTKNQSNFENKGDSVKKSFERLLDNTTQRIVRISESDKQNIYTLLRWFLVNYNNLLHQNNDDLANKRLRLNECFIYPLLEVWTEGVLRILNGKNITMKNLKSLFSNIQPNFLIRNIKVNDSSRYLDTVDSIDILNKLKVTIAGKQSISNAKGEIKGKALDPSMIGQIDLVFTSNNAPGETRALTVGAKVNKDWYFSDEPNFVSTAFEQNNSFDDENDENDYSEYDYLLDNSELEYLNEIEE